MAQKERIATVETEDLALSPEEILEDYRLALDSRFASIIGRREVLSGKAKFGIFGDGKEIAQIAMAKAWRPGDFRAGYYRDQTLAFALGIHNIQEFFAQLYAHADAQAEPMMGGRAMNAHFSTLSLDEDGNWRDLTTQFNSSPDLSPTGSQMPRMVGLTHASRLFRALPELAALKLFSQDGNEVTWGTIGNASCAEGLFWEAVNAVAVLGGPLVLSIWDDGYGISVPNEFQIAHGDISRALAGFQRDNGDDTGFEIVRVEGWDYPGLIQAYHRAAALARDEHVPSIVHVVEMTQPQGHSTSGSHERYKPEERLEWEVAFDCLTRMRDWIVEQALATPETLEEMEQESRKRVETIRREAWQAYQAPIREEVDVVSDMIDELSATSAHARQLAEIKRQLKRIQNPHRKNVMQAVRDVLITVRDEAHPTRQVLVDWKARQEAINAERYGSHLYSESDERVSLVPDVAPVFSKESPTVSGFEVLNAGFDAMLARDPRVFAFGEDLGALGGVNQAFAGLQAKYGPLRVADTGIREATIVGQAIGMALRGLRPIAEVQYLDYLLYALQILSDDLATLHWRTHGGQKAPVIIRTRGHRLEGIWHSGSQMAGIIHLLRGIHVLVPRDMTRAAAFYNTLLQSDEPGIVIEVLNGYRLKERLPDNIGEITLTPGVPEILREGEDVTLVTYGAMCRICQEAADLLADVGIDVELIDVQSLLPFDTEGVILRSLKKTNNILFADEDVPGGGAAYMMQQVVEAQKGFYWLDAEPRTLSAREHRPAYGTDGDYFSKPNVESVFETVYELMHDTNPQQYPLFFRQG